MRCNWCGLQEQIVPATVVDLIGITIDGMSDHAVSQSLYLKDPWREQSRTLYQHR